MLQNELKQMATKSVEGNIVAICKNVYNTGKKIMNEYKIECGLAFETYIQQAVNKYSKVKTILDRYEPVYLYDVYVEANLLLGDKNIATDDIRKIVRKNNYILITGTGGIGKTTLMRHLFLNTLDKTTRIPIFVELRDVNNLSETDDILQLIWLNLDRLGFNLGKEYISKALNSGCFVLFLDAFDEVEEAKRIKLKKEIQYICDKYPDNIYIVSSRELNDNPDFLEWSRFTNFKMDVLSKELAIELIKKTNYDMSVKEKFINSLEKSLYDTHKSFASNPLLLLIMLMTYDQYAEIPSKMHLFFQQAFETLYVKHDSNKEGGYKRRLESNLSMPECEGVLSTFSMLSYLKKNRSFNEEALAKYIKKALELKKYDISYLSFKKDMIESLCILVQDGLEYIFTHRIFQEFFASKYIYEMDDKNQQQIYRYIFENLNRSIQEDVLINMMLDMQTERCERNFIIPLLEELYSKIEAKDEDEMLFNFLKLCFGYISTSYDTEELEGRIRLGNFKDGIKYESLLVFLYENYSKEYLPIKIYAHDNNDALSEVINKIGEMAMGEDMIIYLDRLSVKDQNYLIKNGLESLGWYKTRIVYGKQLLQELKKKINKELDVEQLLESLE